MNQEQYFAEVSDAIKKTETKFNSSYKETAIILAAGHGKRIKSKTSKMLHKIYEAPTVERVYDACKAGLQKINSILVVGIKADEIVSAIGKNEATLFAHQQVQHGTGHAVQVGLEKISNENYNGIVYVLPGDMGLLNAETMKDFKDSFILSDNDMMVLTGLYEGDAKLNAYGRIIRVKEIDANGNSSGADFGKVIEIKEHKDILSLNENEPYVLEFNEKLYTYTKEELINNNEFNSGVFAFKYDYLVEKINKIESNNIQKEIYVTDLIAIFNEDGLSVGAVSPKEQYVLMGFNDKTVLKEMNAIAQNLVYDKVKNIIDIKDPSEFYLHESIVDDILKMDEEGIPLDIILGKGSFVGKGVKLNYDVTFGKGTRVEGNVELGKGVKIYGDVHVKAKENQKIIIGDKVKICKGSYLSGNISIGKKSRIDSGVKLNGNGKFPCDIGENVVIKGITSLVGTVVENDVTIEHSVLINQKVSRKIDENGNVISVKYVKPNPEGVSVLSN